MKAYLLMLVALVLVGMTAAEAEAGRFFGRNSCSNGCSVNGSNGCLLPDSDPAQRATESDVERAPGLAIPPKASAYDTKRPPRTYYAADKVASFLTPTVDVTRNRGYVAAK